MICKQLPGVVNIIFRLFWSGKEVTGKFLPGHFPQLKELTRKFPSTGRSHGTFLSVGQTKSEISISKKKSQGISISWKNSPWNIYQLELTGKFLSAGRSHKLSISGKITPGNLFQLKEFTGIFRSAAGSHGHFYQRENLIRKLLSVGKLTAKFLSLAAGRSHGTFQFSANSSSGNFFQLKEFSGILLSAGSTHGTFFSTEESHREISVSGKTHREVSTNRKNSPGNLYQLNDVS